MLKIKLYLLIQQCFLWLKKWYWKKNGTEVTLKLSSNVVGYSNDENNFPYKLLSTETQGSKLQKNDSSANIKFSKTYLHRIRQSEGSLGRLLGPLLKIGLLWYKMYLNH